MEHTTSRGAGEMETEWITDEMMDLDYTDYMDDYLTDTDEREELI
jgi:hypothetical protein